jgi:hypothetical protein
MRIALGVGTAMALSAAALIGSGVASAGIPPNVVGQKYSDATTALSNGGFKPIVSTTVGDHLQRPDCLVTNQVQRTVQPPQNSSGSASNEVLLSLNCEANVAKAGTPGFSAGSPEGSHALASSAAAAATSAAIASQQADASQAAEQGSGG